MFGLLSWLHRYSNPRRIVLLSPDLALSLENSHLALSFDLSWDADAGDFFSPTKSSSLFAAWKAWNHLTWSLERVGNQVHYVSLIVNGQTYNVDTYDNNQPWAGRWRRLIRHFKWT